MEEETLGVDPLTSLPTYVPAWKGKTRVPKDLDERKSSVKTPLLPDDIVFDGAHLGQVLVLKFEDQHLTNHEKFPHLATIQLMWLKKNKVARVVELELHKKLQGVEKAGLLNLL